MRSLYVIFLLGCLLLSLYLLVASPVSPSPQSAACEFLRTIKNGNFAKATASFGDNSCHCPPKGGWSSYLKYESGLEPNLAFMLNKNFSTGSSHITWVKDPNPYLLPWEKPESTLIDISLTFDKNPIYFLPLDLAYGYSMPIDKFEQAVNTPNIDDWKGFALRLRSGLKPGLLIASTPDQTQETAKDLLKIDATKYLVPKDAGNVLLPSGKTLDPNLVIAKLPQLKTATLQLSMMRRGKFKPWKIARFKFINAIVQTNHKQPVLLLFNHADQSVRN